MISSVERTRVRSFFPGLQSDWAFLENAGGSQVPQTVIDSVRRYYTDHYVQLGAGYTRSNEATEIVDLAHKFVEKLINATEGSVLLGSSTTSLLYMISDCYARTIDPGAEIVVAETGHEANVGPWLRLQEQGAKIVWWKVDPELQDCPVGDLDSLLSENTAFVILPQVSNLLGNIADLSEVSRRARTVGARVVADGVAFAPHQEIDVDAWGVDWYVYSTYKVFGPHMAALYGRQDAIQELTGPNHFFIPDDDVPYKFELGGPSHEGCAAILGLADYFLLLNEPGEGASKLRDLPIGEAARTLTRAEIARAFAKMEALENEPKAILVEYLHAHPRVRLVGTDATGQSRVGTVSFVHETKSSADIVAAAHEARIAIRSGHMYAYRLCQALGIDVDDGVVRASLVHYNTPEEIRRLIAVFDSVL